MDDCLDAEIDALAIEIERTIRDGERRLSSLSESESETGAFEGLGTGLRVNTDAFFG